VSKYQHITVSFVLSMLIARRRPHFRCDFSYHEIWHSRQSKFTVNSDVTQCTTSFLSIQLPVAARINDQGSELSQRKRSDLLGLLYSDLDFPQDSLGQFVPVFGTERVPRFVVGTQDIP
jgi:hypothetical protein